MMRYSTLIIYGDKADSQYNWFGSSPYIRVSYHILTRFGYPFGEITPYVIHQYHLLPIDFDVANLYAICVQDNWKATPLRQGYFLIKWLRHRLRTIRESRIVLPRVNRTQDIKDSDNAGRD